MENSPPPTDHVYDVLTRLAEHLDPQDELEGVTKEIALQAAAGAITIPDDELIATAEAMDAEAEEPGCGRALGAASLMTTYAYWRSSPPPVLYSRELDRETVAREALRQGIASKLFARLYPVIRSDQCEDSSYRRSHEYVHGDILALIATCAYFEFIGRPY